MRLLIFILAIIFHVSFLYAEESSFKLTIGSNLASIPLEINKISKNLKKSPGVKINSWILSPKFSSFEGNKTSSNFLEKKNPEDKIYIKFNFNF